MRDIGIESYLNIITNLIPLIAGWSSLKRMDTIVRSYWWYMVISMLVAAVTSVLYMIRFKYGNIYIFHSFNFLEGVYLFWLVGKLTESRNVKRVALVLNVVNVILFIYIILIQKKLFEISALEKDIRNVCLILLLAWMTMEVALRSKIDLVRNYQFWFVFASFFNISMLALHFCLNTWILPGNIYASTYTIHLLFIANYISYILIAKGFICYKHQLNLFGSSHFQH